MCLGVPQCASVARCVGVSVHRCRCRCRENRSLSAGGDRRVIAYISASIQRERYLRLARGRARRVGGRGGEGQLCASQGRPDSSRVSRARVLSRFGLHVAAGGMTSSSVGASRVSSFLTRPIKVTRSCFRDKF